MTIWVSVLNTDVVCDERSAADSKSHRLHDVSFDFPTAFLIPQKLLGMSVLRPDVDSVNIFAMSPQSAIWPSLNANKMSNSGVSKVGSSHLPSRSFRGTAIFQLFAPINNMG